MIASHRAPGEDRHARTGQVARLLYPQRILALLLLVLVSSPAYTQKVKVQYDKSTDFSQLKTYAWKRGTQAPHPGTHQLIIDSVEKQLGAKGFHKAAEGEPDFYVIYHVALGGQVVASSYEYYWPEGAPAGSVRSGPGDAYLEGTLVVDIVDRTGKQLLWQGVASDTIQGVGEKAVNKIEKAVDKLFQKFPPKKKD